MKKLRLGIVGAGAVVREIYQHLYFQSDYSDALEICAVAEPNGEYRKWFGDLAGLPADRRFTEYQDMLAKVELDAVQVNTPDHLHCGPAIAALRSGLDVIVPKPTAATIKDVHQMIEAAKESGRFLGVDFHKREDPRIKEARARFQSGRYGEFQAAVFYMLDKLSVADPNHSPRFFATADFAAKNTPVSFLTVHMADALMQIVNLAPRQVRATGYAHKLPSLSPLPVNGFDLVDTEIVFETGATAHILTGWALPNSAWATTVQSARLICSEGLIDLGLDTPGLREIHRDGVLEINPLFRNFGKDQPVTGYGISSPGRLYQLVQARRTGSLSAASLEEALNPMNAGFYATLVLEAAERSLSTGERLGKAATVGRLIELKQFVTDELGAQAAAAYGFSQD